MTDQEPSLLRRYLAEGVLNLLWLAFTIVALLSIHAVWPYRTWSWGLLLGAAIGGSTVILVAMTFAYTGLGRRLYGVGVDG